MILYLEVYNYYHSKYLQILYLDFVKAFDKVCHQKLLEKVRALGIGEKALRLLESYLFIRKQWTVVNGVLSNVENVQSGVPRGSKVEPMLFIISINDLPQQIMSMCIGYADDYNIIAKNLVILQIDTHGIWKWCQDNMSLNLKKKTVHFKVSSIVKTNQPTIQQAEVEDLGIIVSKSLTWKEQAVPRCEKALRTLSIIKRNISWKPSEI